MTWVVNIALQAWGKTAMVPLAWMTLKLVVIAPAMNVLIATVPIAKRLGVLTLAQGTLMMNLPDMHAGCLT